MREELRNIVTRNGNSGRIPDLLEKELDELEILVTTSNRQVLRQVRVEAPEGYDGIGMSSEEQNYQDGYNAANKEWHQAIKEIEDSL